MGEGPVCVKCHMTFWNRIMSWCGKAMGKSGYNFKAQNLGLGFIGICY
jgi:hypothetical protein